MALDFLNENLFNTPPQPALWVSLPLPNDPCAGYWTELLGSSPNTNPAELLRSQYIQLSFPIQAGISLTPEYLAAVRKGIPPQLVKPYTAPFTGKLTVYLHPTPAGSIPVIETASAEDFSLLLQTLAYKNEPREIPASMGAAFISGLINWRRVALLQQDGMPFSDFKNQPQLYQDNLLLLSNKGYSGVAVAGENEEAWNQHSLAIRLGHESSHYMTRRFYGSAKNAVHDEIIADCMGLIKAYGYYRPELFLLFMGLEDFPRFRKGGRLENYLSNLTLTEAEFEVLCRTVIDAALNIKELCASSPATPEERFRLFEVLCRTTVNNMAEGKFFRF